MRAGLKRVRRLIIEYKNHSIQWDMDDTLHVPLSVGKKKKRTPYFMVSLWIYLCVLGLSIWGCDDSSSPPAQGRAS